MNAKDFANKWVQSWNSHNLDDILNHYADDIQINTPMIQMAFGEGDGTLIGKEAVSAYWSKALEKFPDLHFELFEVTVGVNSVALYYQSIMHKKAIEVMTFNAEGKVCKMQALYTE
ncbi:MAG: nuclear transport factor 2 family protein [Flavobacteriaceae bacterium]|jgi:hypothetical protein|nr:nuclear transport factor 2 family protein [Flavobacteriaceae bacterium]